jgi:hypothetical protein
MAIIGGLNLDHGKFVKLESGLEPLITGFKSVCINLNPQII